MSHNSSGFSSTITFNASGHGSPCCPYFPTFSCSAKQLLTLTTRRATSSGAKNASKGKKPALNDDGDGDDDDGRSNHSSNNGDDDPSDDDGDLSIESIDGPDTSQRPLNELRDIISELLGKAQAIGLSQFVDSGAKQYIRVGTMCSGTDAPLHALNMFGMLKNAAGEQVFTAINVFGCEIEPYKQGFLNRNSKPQLLFRDAADFAEHNAKTA